MDSKLREDLIDVDRDILHINNNIQKINYFNNKK